MSVTATICMILASIILNLLSKNIIYHLIIYPILPEVAVTATLDIKKNYLIKKLLRIVLKNFRIILEVIVLS